MAILPNGVQEKAQVQGESGHLVAETMASYGIENLIRPLETSALFNAASKGLPYC